MKRHAFITGTAGFIGYHLADLLLSQGWAVTGFDGLTDYYDVTLKKARHARLAQYPSFKPVIGRLEDSAALHRAVADSAPEAIVHLAAQAGVRYSLENPRSYIDSNLVGTFNVLEAARLVSPDHLLMASTSSVYGGNPQMPFGERQQTDHPLTLYAATKKANEDMAHSYAHLWRVPTTMFRFFSVYGPWGRPDLALFKFIKAALDDAPIDIYNFGHMSRDFTYVCDLVLAISKLIDAAPIAGEPVAGDSLSPVAPYRVVNIGNSTAIGLMDMVQALEAALGRPIAKRMLPMQPGDVPHTWADTTLLRSITGYTPDTDIADGVSAFVDWYLDYHATSLRQAVVA